MSNHDLAVRQQRLLVRSAQLRLVLADQAQVLRRPLALADQAKNAIQWLYHDPQWPLGALVLVILTRPRRALVWAARLWWSWKIVKQAKNWLTQHALARQLP